MTQQQQNSRKTHYINILLWCLIGIAIGLSVKITIHKQDVDEFNNSKIDSLNYYIDSLENKIASIKPRIDTVYKQKTTTYYIYEEKADSIWNQSTDDDWVYYSNFLSTRFPSDSATTKTN